MEDKYDHECICGHKWDRDDYIDFTEEDSEEYDEKAIDYADGSECPKCGSEDVGEEGWKD